MIRQINSKDNSAYKYALKIRSGKIPEHFILEGKKLFDEAVNAGLKPISIFLNDIKAVELPKNYFALTFQISQQLFKKLSSLTTPSNIAAIFRHPKKVDFCIAIQSSKLVVVLDRLQDPGNIGNILRTSEAMGVDLVCSLPQTCSFYNDKVIRASMGSIFRLPIAEQIAPKGLIDSLRSNSFSTIATDMNGSDICHFSFPKRCAIFLGKEGTGLDKKILKECDLKLAINMQGQVESLNVAISSAICLFEYKRQLANTLKELK